MVVDEVVDKPLESFCRTPPSASAEDDAEMKRRWHRGAGRTSSAPPPKAGNFRENPCDLGSFLLVLVMAMGAGLAELVLHISAWAFTFR